MEESISLKELFLTLKKRMWLIASITIVAVLITGLVSYFVLTPIYSASTQILVNQSKSEESLYQNYEVQTSLQLINTYSVILKSPRILNEVIGELNLSMSADELNEEITVESESDSQVVNITVEDKSPTMAANIANTTAKVFQKNIANIMNVDNVAILAEATISDNPTPIKPQPILNMLIGLVVGLMVGVGLAFLLEYMDNTIKTEQDIENLFNVPVLGVIPIVSNKTGKQRGSENNVGEKSII